MDNLTHTLIGLTLARAGAGRAAPYATLGLVVAANLSDIDYVYAFGGPVNYLAHRGTWSHSLAGTVALAGGMALLLWLLTLPKPAPHRLRNLFLVCQLGAVSHLLLDWAGSAGIQLLYPFRETFYALDWLPAVDLWLVAFLLLGLLLPLLFRLISEEIGAGRSSAGARRGGAAAALVACLLLAAGRGALHADGEAQLHSRLYRGRTPERVGAFPTPLGPFQWHGVVETESTYESLTINFLGAQGGDDSARSRYKPANSATLEAALATRTADVFLSRARFPHLEVLPQPDGWQVRLRDIRYAFDASAWQRHAAWIDLDADNKVISEGVRWGRLGDRLPEGD